MRLHDEEIIAAVKAYREMTPEQLERRRAEEDRLEENYRKSVEKELKELKNNRKRNNESGY